MTDVQTTPRRPLLVVMSRIPATLILVASLLVVGVLSAGLWTPFQDSPLWENVAYGLPAFLDGRWWTPITGTFFVNHPLVYILTIGSFVGMAYLEFRRGSRVAIAYYTVGQLFAIFASALLVWLFAFLPWPWAQAEALALDVGPSGGAMACLAAAAGLLSAPWRVRAWVVLLGFTVVSLLFWGSLADLEHAVAVVLVLFVDRSLRLQRTTMREQRLLAFATILTLLAVEILTFLVPTDGPFGSTTARGGSILDIGIDIVVVLIVANGLRRGRRWAWVISIILGAFNVLTGVLFVALLVFVPGAEIESSVGDVSVAIAQSALWGVLLVYLLWVRGAFAAHRKATIGTGPEPSVEDVKTALHAHGGGTLSWMTTWRGNSYSRTTDGIVAYQKRAGVAIALADPLGPERSRAQSVQEFITMAERAGLIPCFFSAGDATKAAVPDSWRNLVVADDTIVDLPGLEFTGKAWSAVRTSINRAAREDVTFRMTRLSDEPWGVQQQLRAISEMWVGDKGLPEMGFTLGTLDEAKDPEVRLALAVSANGDVDGFLSWLPIFGDDGKARGWTLDLMRRRDGGFGPVMEFLIGSSAKHFSEEGAQIMSLSGAPLSHDYPPDAGAIAGLSDWLAKMLEPVYGFGSLHRFKEKFHPRYETMYLLFRDETDLTRIGAGLTRAFLPDATLRQFAGAGVELMRGERD
ncbi:MULTISPECIES: DUF2156 domain-containing protein [unclassified Microbacterium]|uniref:bifunctional lysylphosphatidylglycerol flippase/synthetase MprF n=1 Tax=unclassified Microbacterium TaxID=2609290 RepID=UPI00214B777A|nr:MULTISPECIES: DUF2156 domain-containing protein [unclassified Microbacterium]MCR2808279.1 DUF2156 domain-containing protein [Microbacterium sp. zg.B185]WIM19266.1 DUF2156 domain-containing protein [Microbacterium sp. zg-B185]